MKILHTVEFYDPSVGGAQEVVKRLSELLVSYGHQVTVATTKLDQRNSKVIRGVNIEEFAISGNTVRGMTGEIERYQRFVRESDFDIVMCYAAQQWTTDAILPILDQIKAKKVLVPCGFSGLFLNSYQEYFSRMKTWMNEYDACIFLSDVYRDRQFAREAGVKNAVLIPNGAAESEFLPASEIDIRSRLNIPWDHFLVLHVGSHTGLKGHRDVIRMFNRARVTNATLLMIGNSISGGCQNRCRLNTFLRRFDPRNIRREKKILLKDLNRAETVAAYQSADLFLFPSWIECSPIVLFESMAARTPFLATNVGNSEEIVKWGNGGALIQTTVDMQGYSHADIADGAERIERLWSNPDLAERMAESGFQSWQAHFSWEKIAREYEKLYFGLSASR